ncbi:retrotransposon hot spot (RHS) protein, putative, partial [Trypanosoma cruzi marinkellei]
MSSCVRDILLEGETDTANMKMNGFLWSEFGKGWAVKRNGNVSMEAFFIVPEMSIHENKMLGGMAALPSYQELEAIYKLEGEGVFSLSQWKDFDWRDTMNFRTKGKLDAALEAADRDSEQLTKLTISTKIEDVLFKGRIRVVDIKLNEFLTRRSDGKDVVDTNTNALLRNNFEDLKKYTCNKGALNEIQALDGYLMMKRAVRVEMDLEEDINKIDENGANNLLGRPKAAAEVNATVRDITKNSLDAAAEE